MENIKEAYNYRYMKTGIIKISDILYSKDYPIISGLFKHFRPTRIEYHDSDINTWHLYGESELFEEIKDGDSIPYYSVIFTSKPDNTYSFKFQKI